MGTIYICIDPIFANMVKVDKSSKNSRFFIVLLFLIKTKKKPQEKP